MKKTVLILLSVFALTSCDKWWDLNMTPGKPVFADKGSEGVIRGNLTSAYSMLLYNETIAEYYWGQVGGMDTDESFRYNVSNQTNMPGAHNIVPSSNCVRDIWKAYYKVNEFCNTAIMMCPSADDLSQAEKNDICGQAMVLKAFSHFILAQYFGPVPIKADPSYDMGLETELERKPVGEVCQYALDLCRDAIPLLKGIEEVGHSGRITRSAAEALSYRIALYMASHPDIMDEEKYDLVAQWAEDFINNGPNRLNTVPLVVGNETLPAYARLFVKNMKSDATWDSENPEGIWTILFFCKSVNSGPYSGGRYKTAMRLGSQMGIPCPDRTSSSPMGYCDLTYRVLNNLWDKYLDTETATYPRGDLRRDWNIPTYCYKNVSGEALAAGCTPATRYDYFKVYLPEDVKCTREAVLLPVIDKSTWTYSSGNLAAIYVEDGGEGYTNSAGETSFTIEIPKISRPATLSAFNRSVGGVICFKSGNNRDASSGLQRINAANTTSGITVTVVNGTIRTVEKTDTRAANIGTGFTMVTERGVGKWRREYEEDLPPIREQSVTACHFPILRYADVLLMAAEANLMSAKGDYAKGLEYLNQVRRRAYGKDVYQKCPEVDFSSYTLETIMDERSRELCFEGVRRMDLIRWNAYTGSYNAIQRVIDGNPHHSYLTYAIERLGDNYEKYRVLPIPSDEMGLCSDKFYQNTGW